MRLKKFLAAAMISTFAFGAVAMAAPVAAYAAEETGTTAKDVEFAVYYDEMVATITSPGKAKYVFLEVLKENKADAKVSATYAYEANEGEAVVDLSFLKVKADSYVRVYSNLEPLTEKTPIYTVNKQPEKLKVKFVAGASELAKAFTITEGKTAVTDVVAALEAGKYEFKTLYGTYWEDLASWDMKSATVAGTTLVVRTAAQNTDTEKKIAGAMASAEVKVKIAAQAKAPKVKVDYVKGTVAMTDKLEYKVLIGNEEKVTGDTGWVAGEKKAMTPADILTKCGVVDKDDSKAQTEALNAGFMLVVRTAAVAGKKAASQAAFVSILPQASLSYTAKAEELIVEKDKVTLTWTTEENGVKFVATGAAFEYYDTTKSKWVTIKAGEKGALCKLADTSKATTVEVRVAGVKETKEVKAAMPSLSVKVDVAAYVDPDVTAVAEAKTLAEKWVSETYTTASNDDTNDTIKTAVETAIKSVEGVTVKVEVTVVKATTEGAGSVKGKITLTKGEASAEVAVDKTIAQLSAN
ncbi:MAG: hypothetical protein IJY09_01930 [Lachnospiraceae bacterium]|nr:hypothetical protein [Lachnospiraceae bacterium]